MLLAHVVDGSGDLHDALGSPIRRFQRHDYTITGAKRGEGNETKPGWAIEDDQVVEAAEGSNRVDESMLQIRGLPRSLVRQIEAGEKGVAGQEVDMRISRATDEAADVDVRRRIEQPFDAGSGAPVAIEGVAEVALRIGVDQQASQTAFFAN